MPLLRSLCRRLAGLGGFLAWAVFAGLAGWAATAQAQPAEPRLHPVGIRQMEYADPSDGRPVAFALFYPASPAAGAAAFKMQFFKNLSLYWEAPVAAQDARRPLVLLSHGRGSNGAQYAWLGEYLAARGYIVAALYHYRANTYDAHVAYLANRLWQRPRDLGLAITLLLQDDAWGPRIDADRIGAAGHSQGGFTALWVGGAAVNPEKYRAFQRVWRDNRMVPAYLRRELPLDPQPAQGVRDARVKAVFAMAPGDIQAFGMDETGLRQLRIPTYIIVGARDTQTPPEDNAGFAARHIAQAELEVLPGLVDHEIFVNECDEVGRDAWPGACIDAEGIDRAKLHAHIGAAALRFFDRSLGVEREPRN